MPKRKNIGSYIVAAPKELRGKLRQLRAIIRNTAPHAVEKISYGMPYYAYKGRLAYFALSKNHIGLYLPSPVIAEHKHDLKKFETSMATIRFPLNRRLPLALIKKLIRVRMEKNEMKAAR